MNTSQIIACAITWAAAIAAVVGATLALRAQQQAQAALIAIRAEQRTFSIPGGGQITVTAPMSDAEYEAFRARWQATYGQRGSVCGAYQPSSSSEDSGLCARCGMFDYKHQETADA